MPLSTIFQLYIVVEERGVHEENTDLSQVTDKSHNVVSSTRHHEQGLNSQLEW